MLQLYKKGLLVLVALFVVAAASPVAFTAIASAQTATSTTSSTTTTTAATGKATCTKTFLGFPTWYKYLPISPAPQCTIITKDIGGQVAVLILMAVIEILLSVAGIIAVGFVIFGAFKFITSQADPQKIAGARTTIANALVGLVIALVASKVVAFIGNKLSASATNAAVKNGALDGTNIPQVTANTAQLQSLLSFIFVLAGAIALLVITIAGFNFVTSQGEPQKVAKARMTILYAVVGLVVAVFAFVIVKFVVGNVG